MVHTVIGPMPALAPHCQPGSFCIAPLQKLRPRVLSPRDAFCFPLWCFKHAEEVTDQRDTNTVSLSAWTRRHQPATEGHACY